MLFGVEPTVRFTCWVRGFDKLSYFACQSFYSATLVLREINDLWERRNAKIASNPLLLT
jgi:hypothetical protein